jgi:hypothetical protein
MGKFCKEILATEEVCLAVKATAIRVPKCRPSKERTRAPPKRSLPSRLVAVFGAFNVWYGTLRVQCAQSVSGNCATARHPAHKTLTKPLHRDHKGGPGWGVSPSISMAVVRISAIGASRQLSCGPAKVRSPKRERALSRGDDAPYVPLSNRTLLI